MSTWLFGSVTGQWKNTNVQIETLKRDLLPLLGRLLDIVQEIKKPITNLPKEIEHTTYRAIVFKSNLKKEEVDKALNSLDHIAIQFAQITQGLPYVNHSIHILTLLSIIDKIQKMPQISIGYQLQSEDHSKLNTLKQLLQALNNGKINKEAYDEIRQKQFKEGQDVLTKLLKRSIIEHIESLIFKSPLPKIDQINKVINTLDKMKKGLEMEHFFEKRRFLDIVETLYLIKNDNANEKIFDKFVELLRQLLKVDANVSPIKVSTKVFTDFLMRINQEQEFFIQTFKSFEFIVTELKTLDENKEELNQLQQEREKNESKLSSLQLKFQTTQLEKNQLEAEKQSIEEGKDTISVFAKEDHLIEAKQNMELQKQEIQALEKTINKQKETIQEKIKLFQKSIWEKNKHFYTAMGQTVNYDQFTQTRLSGKEPISRFEQLEHKSYQILGLSESNIDVYGAIGQFEALKEYYFQTKEEVDQINAKLDLFSKKLTAKSEQKHIKTLDELLAYYETSIILKQLSEIDLVPEKVKKELKDFKVQYEEKLDISKCTVTFTQQNLDQLEGLRESLHKELIDPNLGIFYQFKREIDKVVALASSTTRSKEEEEIYQDLKKVDKVISAIPKKVHSKTEIEEIKRVQWILEKIRTGQMRITMSKEQKEECRKLLSILNQSEVPYTIPEGTDLEKIKKAISEVLGTYETSTEKFVRKQLEMVNEQFISLLGSFETKFNDMLIQEAPDAFLEVRDVLKLVIGFERGITYLNENQKSIFDRFNANMDQLKQLELDETQKNIYESLQAAFKSQYSNGESSAFNLQDKAFFEDYLKQLEERMQRHIGLLAKVGNKLEKEIKEHLQKLNMSPPKELKECFKTLQKANTRTPTTADLSRITLFINEIKDKKINITQAQCNTLKELWVKVHKRGKLDIDANEFSELLHEMTNIVGKNSGEFYYLEAKVTNLVQSLAKVATVFSKETIDLIFWRLMVLLVMIPVVVTLSTFGYQAAMHGGEYLMKTKLKA